MGVQYMEIFRSRSIQRLRTEYFPVLPDPRIAIIDLLYEFRATIVMGNTVKSCPLTDQ